MLYEDKYLDVVLSLHSFICGNSWPHEIMIQKRRGSQSNYAPPDKKFWVNLCVTPFLLVKYMDPRQKRKASFELTCQESPTPTITGFSNFQHQIHSLKELPKQSIGIKRHNFIFAAKFQICLVFPTSWI